MEGLPRTETPPRVGGEVVVTPPSDDTAHSEWEWGATSGLVDAAVDPPAAARVNQLHALRSMEELTDSLSPPSKGRGVDIPRFSEGSIPAPRSCSNSPPTSPQFQATTGLLEVPCGGSASSQQSLLAFRELPHGFSTSSTPSLPRITPLHVSPQESSGTPTMKRAPSPRFNSPGSFYLPSQTRQRAKVLVYTPEPSAAPLTTEMAFRYRMIRETLGKHCARFVFVDMDSEPRRAEEIEELSDEGNTGPYIFVGERYIGGYRRLLELSESGDLDDILVAEGLIEDMRSGGSSPVQGGAPPWRTLQGEEEAARLMEMVVKMQQSDAGVAFRDVRHFMKTYRRCFVGSDATEWIARYLEIPREAAVKIGQFLMNANVISNVTGEYMFLDDGHLFRFQEEVEGVLNLKSTWIGPRRPTAIITRDLRELLTEMYSKYVDPEGRWVDYQGLAHSEPFLKYVYQAVELQWLDLRALSREEKLTFFLNIYNVMVIHGILFYGPPNSIMSRAAFPGRVVYNLGGTHFSLSDIEHGILRCNRRPWGALHRQFRKKDTRRLLSVSVGRDPRVHAAVNHGTRGSPPLRVYVPETVEDDLRFAMESYCELCKVDIDKREVTLPIKFRWYKHDFGDTTTEVLAYVAPFLSVHKREQVHELAASGGVTLKFENYDIELNGKPDEGAIVLPTKPYAWSMADILDGHVGRPHSPTPEPHTRERSPSASSAGGSKQSSPDHPVGSSARKGSLPHRSSSPDRHLSREGRSPDSSRKNSAASTPEPPLYPGVLESRASGHNSPVPLVSFLRAKELALAMSSAKRSGCRSRASSDESLGGRSAGSSRPVSPLPVSPLSLEHSGHHRKAST